VIVQQVVEAAREVLETAAATRIVGTAPGGPLGSVDGVIAMLSFSGTRAGTLVLCCRLPVAAALAGGMLGLPTEDLDEPTVRDALGELVNQVGGTLKRRLAVSGAAMALSVPSVVAGRDVRVKVLATGEPQAVDVAVPAGTLHVRLWLPS
jgi:CheY-specific phosphatase CheX